MSKKPSKQPIQKRKRKPLTEESKKRLRKKMLSGLPEART